MKLDEIRQALTGTLPFPNLGDWMADGALFALQALKNRLSESPDPVGSHLITTLAASPLSVWQAKLLHPSVFAFLAKEPEPCTWQHFQEEIDRDGDPVTPPGTNIRVWSNPGPRFELLLRSLGRGSRGLNCSMASFVNQSSPQFFNYLSRIADAIQLLETVTPGFAADIRSVVHAVAFVDKHASFRGSSGVIHRGLVLLSPDESWNVYVFAEELVHEATHNLLDLISLREPLLGGAMAFEERYQSPFRPDPRHLYGNFHALIVVSRLVWLFKAFEDYEVGSRSFWREKEKDYCRRASQCSLDVQKYQGLSPNARFLMNQLVAPTLKDFEV